MKGRIGGGEMEKSDTALLLIIEYWQLGTGESASIADLH
jgi:hypothetical protein